MKIDPVWFLTYFSLPALLLFLTVFTGIMWLLNIYVFSKKRQAAAEQAVHAFEQQHPDTTGIDPLELAQKKQILREKYLRMPWWLEYTAGFFGVVCMVFILRSFIAEPFRIPSASMMPTLQSGDLILVNKFSWGIRMPVWNKTMVNTGSPDRGDVMVFRFPPQPSVDFIKRVIGLPGDTLEYKNKILTLNNQVIASESLPDVLDETGEKSNVKMSYVHHFIETLPKQAGGTMRHDIFNTPSRSPSIEGGNLFNHPEACTYLVEGIRCTVPKGHYFVMGDNRDNSQDSRWWGFVPEDHIVGHAFLIWMNLGFQFNRIGRIQ